MFLGVPETHHTAKGPLDCGMYDTSFLVEFVLKIQIVAKFELSRSV